MTTHPTPTGPTNPPPPPRLAETIEDAISRVMMAALRGKHNKAAGTASAKSAGKVPKHGGPQTGNGYTAQGRKPKASETRLRLPKWLGGKG